MEADTQMKYEVACLGNGNLAHLHGVTASAEVLSDIIWPIGALNERFYPGNRGRTKGKCPMPVSESTNEASK